MSSVEAEDEIGNLGVMVAEEWANVLAGVNEGWAMFVALVVEVETMGEDSFVIPCTSALVHKRTGGCSDILPGMCALDVNQQIKQGEIQYSYVRVSLLKS